MKNNIPKIDYSLVEQSLNNQLLQILSGLAVVPDLAFKKYERLLIVGMGGSRLPADILINCLADKILIPITIISDYSLPEKLLKPDTMVVAMSYSGETEEVLSAVEQAKQNKVDVYTISAGGQLAKVPAVSNIVFTTTDNQSQQPRYGVGYMLGALLGLMQSLKVVDLSLKEIKESLALTAKEGKKIKNQMLKLIPDCYKKIPVLVASEHLSGLTLMMQNQIHETAKNFACQFVLPNLNHHLLEGLAVPKNNNKNFHFILFNSDLYHPRNQQRIKLTLQIIKKQGFSGQVLKLTNNNKLTQALALLLVAGNLSLGLAKYNKVDPKIVPWVDYFKKSLAQ